MASVFGWPLRAITMLLLLAVWTLVAYLAARPGLYPTPLDALGAAHAMFIQGVLVNDMLITAAHVGIGFAAGGCAGVVLGIATGRLPAANYSIGQILTLLRPVPSIAILPFVIIWVGIGEPGKLIIIAWASLFPVWVATHLGVLRSSVRLERIARTCGASERQIVLSVILPNALPLIVAGLRTSLGAAFVSLYAAEMSGGPGGIGFRISASHANFQVDAMIVGLACLATLGALADGLFVVTTRRLAPWILSASRD